MKYILYISVFFLTITLGHAQYDHEAVFEGKTDEELRILLVDNFTPSVVLTYSQARDTMYGIIYNVNDSIAGIYSDHKVYLKPGEDPSTYIFKNGEVDGINAEHSYPQSKGAENGNARSDMHHLFPARVGTNSARGSLPFAEINDDITNQWYYKNQENSNKPIPSKIDLYSEKGNESWEPRESVKGNIARAIFYFYTIYQDQADNADPTFFSGMKETLCNWHDLDPVDELEWNRTKMISNWQDGKSNPFVLDCTLASRLYCSEVSPECITVDIAESKPFSEIKLCSNPANDFAVFKNLPLGESLRIHSRLTSTYGSLIHEKTWTQDELHASEVHIPLDNLQAGSYIIQWFIQDISTSIFEIVPFIIIKQ